MIKKSLAGSIIFEGILEVLWLVVIFTLPLLFWPGLYTTFELPKVVFLRVITMIMLVVWLVKIVVERQVLMPLLKLKGRSLIILLGLVGGFFVLATVLSVAPVVSFAGWYPRFQGLYTFFCYAVLGGVIFLNVRTEKQVERLMTAIFSSAALVGLSAFLQRAAPDFLNFWDVSAFLGRVFGTMGHPDFLATFLIMVIPIMLARLLQKKNLISASLGLIFSLSALYFTLSRSAYLGLFIGLIFFFLVLLKKYQKKKLFWLLVIIPMITSVGILMVNVFANQSFIKNQPILQRLVFQGENLRSLQSRAAIWPATMRQIMDRPLWGYGPGTFAISFAEYTPASLNTLENFGDIADHAHNETLDTAAQIGILGVLAYLGFLVLLFVMGVQKFLSDAANANKKDGLLYLGLLSGLLSLFVANQFGFSVTVHYVVWTVFVALLLRWFATKECAVKLVFLGKNWRGVLMIVIITMLGAGLVWLQDIRLVEADFWYRSGTDKMAGQDYAGAFSDLKQAATLAPQYGYYQLAVAADALLATPKNYKDPKFLDDALQTMESAIAARNEDALSLYYKAKIEAGLAAQNPDRATLMPTALNDFKQAAAKAPTYPLIYLDWGKALLAAQKPAEAMAVFQTYLNLSPPYYQWKNSLDNHTPEERERYRIFYKLNPDFDEILDLLEQAKTAAN